MLSNLIGLILLLLPIALAIWVIENYFPALPKLIKAFVIASVVIAIIRLLHEWTCQLLCGPFIP